jgi:hypothetical protein
MSVAQFIAFRSALEAMHRQAPKCWALLANPVTARFERTVVVAVFDTEAAAREYLRSAKLATPGIVDGDPATNMCGRAISRTFRKRSLLWDFNPHAGGSTDEATMVQPIDNPRFYWDPEVPENPAPLPDEVPALEAR